VLGPAGEILSRYDKHHLFHWSQGSNAVDEGSFFQPGATPPAVFPWRGWKIALVTCFDLRFPAFWQAARPRPDLFLCPAAFTDITGKAHWRPLLQARAIENLAWVAGIGLGGENQETGLALHGHSCVFDPWGRRYAGSPQRGSAVLRLILNLDRVSECRRRLPLQPDDSLPLPEA
jgi:nitrilase